MAEQQITLANDQSGTPHRTEALSIGTPVAAMDNLHALHMLGVLAAQFGQNETAITLMNLAIKANPTEAFYYNDLGNTLEKISRVDAAIEAYQKALSLNPNYALAHSNMGNALNALGKRDEAVACYKRALRLEPRLSNTCINLGIVLQAQGKLSDARIAFEKAISVEPTALAHFDLGNVLAAQGNAVEAIASFKSALVLSPEMNSSHINLGNALQAQGKLKAAIASYQNAIAFKPDSAEAYYNLANMYRDQDKIKDAAACYERALLFKPDCVSAYSNLLYMHSSARDISPEAECRLAAGWEKSALDDDERTVAANRKFVREPRDGRKLFVGIVSAEIGEHSVAEFLEPFLEQVDHERFHITLFPTTTKPGARADRILALADDFKSLVDLSDSAAAELIRFSTMDILIDTTGHTADCRLGIFAHRAAPVQATYIGYLSTTGLTEMDWYIGDHHMTPAFDAHFVEAIWRLPRLAMCYRGDHALPESGWKPAADGTVWLGSFNRYCKIGETSLRLWAWVMNAIPESKLLLEDRAMDDSDTHERIVSALGLHGIGRERIEFEPYVSGHERHMTLYDRLDIALDTVPFNSVTTACDALWMGVPLITLQGECLAGTIASNFLRALGKPEWIAQNEDEYVGIVADLARNVQKRTALRATQRALMASSSMCDSKSLAKALEGAFDQMFAIYQGRSDNNAQTENSFGKQ